MFLFALFELPLIYAAILILFSFAWMSHLVEEDEGAGATGLMVVTLALLHIGGVINLNTAFHHPVFLLSGLAIYSVIGFLWSIAKWQIYTGKIAREARLKIDKYTTEFLRDHGLQLGEQIPGDKRVQDDYRYLNNRIDELGKPEDVQSNISRIVAWASYWPLSLLRWIINDPISRLYHYVLIDLLGGTFQKIANRKAVQVQSKIDVIKSMSNR